MSRAKALFGCFRRADANDPETYVAAVAAILSEYPAEVIEYVTDPRTGLPRTSKWLPTIAEIAEACDKEKSMGPLREKYRGKSPVVQVIEYSPGEEERERIALGMRALCEGLRAKWNSV